MPTRHTTPPISPPPGQQDQSARLAASAQVDQVEGTIHPEKTGWDKLQDSRFVLAKGAGPGIWNHWVTHVAGHRVFWSHVHLEYRA